MKRKIQAFRTRAAQGVGVLCALVVALPMLAVPTAQAEVGYLQHMSRPCRTGEKWVDPATCDGTVGIPPGQYPAPGMGYCVPEDLELVPGHRPTYGRDRGPCTRTERIGLSLAGVAAAGLFAIPGGQPFGISLGIGVASSWAACEWRAD